MTELRCLNCSAVIQPEEGPRGQGAIRTKYCTARCGRQYAYRQNPGRQRQASKRWLEKTKLTRVVSPEKKAAKHAYNRAYSEQHREQIVANSRAYEPTRRAEKAAYMREYNQRPEVVAKMRQWYVDNRVRLREKQRRWVAANQSLIKALRRAGSAKRRALVKPLTEAARRRVYEDGEWTCYLCGIPTPKELIGTYDPQGPTVDHVVAVANGGTNDRENLRCACRLCNLVKRHRNPMIAAALALPVSEKSDSSPERDEAV